MASTLSLQECHAKYRPFTTTKQCQASCQQIERPASLPRRKASKARVFSARGCQGRQHARAVRQCVRLNAQRGGQGELSDAREESDTSSLQQLLGWLIANGVDDIGQEDSKLALFKRDDGQRGLVFTEDLSEGKLILKIPLRLALTDRNVKDSSLADGRSRSDLRLAANLLAEAELGKSSPWYPFIQSLPKEVCSLYGSWPEAATDELQLTTVPRDMHHALNASSESGTENERLKWALSVVNSRSFALAGGGPGQMATRLLLPLADMFNHGGNAAHLLITGDSSPMDNVRWEIAQSGDGQELTFQCSTTAAVEEGEEALISYGQISSWNWLLFYGFVPLRNIHDQVVLFEDISEAVDWFLDRFPPEESMAEGVRFNAVELARASSPPLAKALENDIIAVAHHEAIIATARLGGDTRLWDAFDYLTKQTNARSSDGASAGKVDRIIALRAAEKLFAPQITSLLTDLRLLASSTTEDEHDRAYFAALLNYYTRVLTEFDEEFSAFKLLAQSLQPSDADKSSAKSTLGKFDPACQMALRYRTSQKQVLWELMLSLLK